MKPVNINEQLESLVVSTKERFEAQKRVLGFKEYLELFSARPREQARDAASYLRDCFDHFGSYDVKRYGGSVKRYRLFDGLSPEVSDSQTKSHAPLALYGHEDVQHRVYRVLTSFVREGRPNRLILLHGPNGSAKSTFVACIMRALEVYSEHDDGALYRFSWVFPKGTEDRSIGFSSSRLAELAGESYAHLPEAQLEAKLTSGLREHPLLLIPLAERQRWLTQLYGAKMGDEAPPDGLMFGELGHKNRQIFEALLTAYRGDLSRVWAHVQIERFYHSRRYRVGLVTIGPEMAVDAHEKQVTMDRSLANLPASLSSLTLYETFGELVDAAGGMIEYSDLLKRPLDAWRYLLLAIESGEVSLTVSKLPLNCVLFASTNDLHLNAFKAHHEYPSFRARFQTVRMPYLLSYLDEKAIYENQIVPRIERKVAPHTIYVTALWAVLTRLRRPQADNFENHQLGKLSVSLKPMEKAELYAEGIVPSRFGAEASNDLRTGIAKIAQEQQASGAYDGLLGVSSREIRDLLLEASQDPQRKTLTPLSVLERLEQFCQRSDHEFLKQEVDHGYHDHRDFIRQARDKWLNLVNDELCASTGLVEENRYVELFQRYVTHVSYWIKNERVFNPVTGQDEPADLDMMNEVERMLDTGKSPDEFRRQLMGQIAGHSLDHPNEAVDYTKIFPRYLGLLKDAYFNERKGELAKVARDILDELDEHERDQALNQQQLALVQGAIKAFRERYGYNDEALKEALGALLTFRYA